MKITMYELLGMVKDKKELPKKVKVLDVIYEFDDHYGDYYNEPLDRYLFVYMTSEEEWKLAYFLNIQVEILEEEKKITPTDFENLGYALGSIQKYINKGYDKAKEEKKIPEKLNKLLYREDYATQNACIDDIIRQFNNLIDYLKSKGDE